MPIGRHTAFVIFSLLLLPAPSALAQASVSGLPCPIPPAQESSPPSGSADLTGDWDGRFGVPGRPGEYQTERVKIEQDGAHVVAIKSTGNTGIPVGKITFCGNYLANTFDVQIQIAGLNYSNPQWAPARVTVLDKDHLRLDNDQTFQRIAYAGQASVSPPPTVTPAPPVSPSPVPDSGATTAPHFSLCWRPEMTNAMIKLEEDVEHDSSVIDSRMMTITLLGNFEYDHNFHVTGVRTIENGLPNFECTVKFDAEREIKAVDDADDVAKDWDSLPTISRLPIPIIQQFSIETIGANKYRVSMSYMGSPYTARIQISRTYSIVVTL
jgi:hypothetical protein